METEHEVTALEQNTTTEGAAQPSVLAGLGINGQQLAFHFINFAIVVAIVWFLILKPLTGKMTERQKLIDESLDNAKKIEDNLRKSEQKFRERTDEAKVEANKIMEKATKNAEDAVKNMKEKAQTEIEQLVESAKAHIASERTSMMSELKGQTTEVIMAALEKMLGEKMTASKDQAMIEELLKKMK